MKISERIVAFFIAGWIFVGITWPFILVYIIVHFLLKYW